MFEDVLCHGFRSIFMLFLPFLEAIFLSDGLEIAHFRRQVEPQFS